MRVVIITTDNKTPQVLINPKTSPKKAQVLAKKKVKRPAGANKDETLTALGFKMGSIYAQKAHARSIHFM